jgi:glutathione S-transferase
MRLYTHVAACSLSPHIVCRELDIPVEVIVVDRKTHALPGGADYLQINGNGYVPALELEDGTVLIEGPAIVQYLADLRPDAGLAPRNGTLERTRLQMWLNFVTSELHKPMAMLFDPAFRPVRQALLDKVSKRLDWLSVQLAGPYLMGAQFTVADPYLFVCLNWSQWHEIDLQRWPALVAFMQRVGARPQVLAALRAEGLTQRDASATFFAPAK